MRSEWVWPWPEPGLDLATFQGFLDPSVSKSESEGWSQSRSSLGFSSQPSSRNGSDSGKAYKYEHHTDV